jgi:hypothetical protein
VHVVMNHDDIPPPFSAAQGVTLDTILTGDPFGFTAGRLRYRQGIVMGFRRIVVFHF